MSKKKGNLTISRPRRSGVGDYINIDLQDSKYAYIASIEMSIEDFGRAITGLGNMYCEFKDYSEDRKK